MNSFANSPLPWIRLLATYTFDSDTFDSDIYAVNEVFEHKNLIRISLNPQYLIQNMNPYGMKLNILKQACDYT